MEWDEIEVTTLVELWDLGQSSGEIARHMGKTRNAVIGKLHRLKRRGHPIKRASSTREQILATAAARRTTAPKRRRRTQDEINDEFAVIQRVRLILVRKGSAAEKPTATPSPYKGLDAWSPLPGIEPLPLLKLTALSCRWPIELANTDDHHFCGAMKIGGPYCLHHASVGRSKEQPRPKSDERFARQYAA